MWSKVPIAGANSGGENGSALGRLSTLIINFDTFPLFRKPPGQTLRRLRGKGITDIRGAGRLTTAIGDERTEIAEEM